MWGNVPRGGPRVDTIRASITKRDRPPEQRVRFTFLGTGTSAGVPAIGCTCAVCTSADARDVRLRTSAALEWTDARGQRRVLLLDAGPDLRQQALRAKMDRLDGIFFTHNHVDHTFGLDEVRRFNAVQRAPIEVFADQHTMEFLRRVFRHIFDSENNVNQSFVATLIPHIVQPDVTVEFFGVRVTPFRLMHGRLPILGYRLESDLPGASEILPLAYCTDVSAVPATSWERLSGLSTLVIDALRHRHHPTHLTLEQSIKIASLAQARQTYFVHMAHDLPHQETQDGLPEGMSLAFDGLALGI